MRHAWKKSIPNILRLAAWGYHLVTYALLRKISPTRSTRSSLPYSSRGCFISRIRRQILFSHLKWKGLYDNKKDKDNLRLPSYPWSGSKPAFVMCLFHTITPVVWTFVHWGGLPFQNWYSISTRYAHACEMVSSYNVCAHSRYRPLLYNQVTLGTSWMFILLNPVQLARRALLVVCFIKCNGIRLSSPTLILVEQLRRTYTGARPEERSIDKLSQRDV